MNILKPYFSRHLLLSVGMLLLFSIIILSAFHPVNEAEDQTAPPISVTPNIPKDIFTDGTAADQANLTQAANFAWNEFIALNWPAKNGFRDSANVSAKFGSPANTLVWHTFRHKVEIYPGNGKPPPGYDSSAPDYGYNTASPSYFYDPASVGTSDGQVPPCSGTQSKATPWINLDEKNEIGVTTMYAGVSANDGYPDPQILFLAKANKQEYIYVSERKWWNVKDKSNGLAAAKKNTVDYINKNHMTPPYSSGKSTVSFPPGTIEVKTAWRRLSEAEKNSGRFYSTTVRYYAEDPNTKKPCYHDEEFGMLALHIIHKTPTAPYFIYATFEQADNILTTDGQPVEDVDGNIIANHNATPTTPPLTVVNATPTKPQMISPQYAHSTPGKSLYYININSKTNSHGIPVGTITYNRRYNPIPSEIIAVNKQAHKAIASYNKGNSIQRSPWPYYKLVNVQYKPLQKQAGKDYVGPDRASYYLSNSVVESDYTLQMFSGQFGSGNNFDIMTDYKDASGHIAYNAYNKGAYLMGGCMGCHGNATNKGTDYSFILGNAVAEPEYAQPVKMNNAKFKALQNILSN